jgi:uncharacterized damage-inducible protein DinB
MVGGIENEGESMPRTRKSHPPSLKARVAIEAIKGHNGGVLCAPRTLRAGMNFCMDELQNLRYPIGPFKAGSPPDTGSRLALLSHLADVPNGLRAAVTGLSDSQLDAPYRPGGWTVRQVVHHLADAQMNWYIRTKLALTEDEPHVSHYDEVQWAELHDARTQPLEPSLMLLDGLHRRWVGLFKSLTAAQWRRKLIHPDRGIFILDVTLAMWTLPRE